MKNKFYLIPAATVIAVYAIINILVFTIVPFARVNNAQFWTSWCFMFVFNALVGITIGVTTRAKNSGDIRLFPMALFVGGNIVYFVLGLIFALTLPAIKWVVLTDCLVAIVYALLVFKYILSIRYIRGNDEHKRQKVAYIRQMTAMVEDYISIAPDPDCADLIKKLAADFRYSDPMSHASLAESEQRLLDMVVDLESVVESGNAENIAAAVNEIKRELKRRNAKCINLK